MTMKKLGDILKAVEIVRITGNTTVMISGVTFDSRQVKPGMLFIAVRGSQNDGHAFISRAVESGAAAIVCEEIPSDAKISETFVMVKDSAKALGLISSEFYDNPSSKLKLVGITGTNGKTTTITLLHGLFSKLGYKSGCFTTIRNYIGDKVLEATHTTPDPVQLHRILKEMVDYGCQYAFMEVSSHALAQQRVAGLQFAGAIFSNITHDHLDYHKTFDEYLRAKKLFFDNLSVQAFALINNDDRNGKIMVQNTSARVHYYGVKTMAEFKAKVIESHIDGMLLQIDQQEVWTKLIGEFNAYNLLAVYASACLLGQKKEEVLQILSNINTVEGRFQYVQSKSGITAIIDYAHTPDALSNVLRTIQQIKKGNEQVIAVVGAGGNRDKTKRPVMAKVAADLSNRLILTSDNPRYEEPMDILNDMKAGLDNEALAKTLIIADRREAIKTACLIAKKDDIVLIAGKGHENYQDIKGVKYHFSDLEIVNEIFNMTKS